MTDSIEFVVGRDGDSRHILDETPDRAELYQGLGEVTEIYRNSHVEPTSELSDAAATWLACHKRLGNNAHYRNQDPLPAAKFWADMLPVGGPVLGPYDTRTEALAAEVAWLKENHLPEPKRSDDNDNV